MIRLSVGDRDLVLKPGTEIRIDLNNPCFGYGEIEASIGLNFDIPVCEENDIALSFARMVAISDRVKVFDCCSLYFDGVFLFFGKLVLQSTIDNEYYRAGIVIGGQVSELKSKKLRDIDMGSVNMGADVDERIARMKDIAMQEFPNVAIQFPTINNSVYYESGQSVNEDFQGLVNAYNDTDQVYKKNEVTEFPLRDNITAMSAQVYLLHVYRKIFEHVQMNVSGNIFSDKNFKDILVFSNVDNGKQVRRFFVELEFSGSLEWSAGPIIEIPFDIIIADPQNVFNTTTHQYDITHTGTHIIKGRVVGNYPSGGTFDLNLISYINNVPQETTTITMGVTFDEEFEVAFFATDANIGDKATLRISSPSTSGSFFITFCEASIDNTQVNSLNVFSNAVEIAKQLPDKNVGDFLTSFGECLGIIPYTSFRVNEVRLVNINELLNQSKVIDITNRLISNREINISENEPVYTFSYDFPDDEAVIVDDKIVGVNVSQEANILSQFTTPETLGDFAFAKALNRYYIVGRIDNIQKELFWRVHFFDFQKKKNTIGEKALRVTPLMATTAQDTNLSNPNTKVGTFTRTPAETMIFGGQEKNTEFRFFRYYGLRPGTDGALFPQSGNAISDVNGNILYDWDLRLNGPRGIYTNLLQNWFEFIKNSDTITANFDLDLKTIVSIIDEIFGEKEVKPWLRVVNKNYIPKTVSFILSDQGIKATQIKLVG
jgi:hypothetical protein